MSCKNTNFQRHYPLLLGMCPSPTGNMGARLVLPVKSHLLMATRLPLTNIKRAQIFQVKTDSLQGGYYGI